MSTQSSVVTSATELRAYAPAADHTVSPPSSRIERAQPRTVTGSQDQGVVDRGVFLYSSSNNIISADGMPRFSQSSMYRRR